MCRRLLLLVSLSTLFATVRLFADPVGPRAAFLLLDCDGTPQEQRILHAQSGTWIINKTRALANTTGQLVYRIRTGNAVLERFHLRLNRVPYRLEFSGDGQLWELLVSTAGISPSPTQLTTQSVGFTPAQRNAAAATGCAWFRIRPAGSSATLQLYQLRLDILAENLPPEFVQPSVWQQLGFFAPGPLMLLVGVLPVSFVWLRWRTTWRIWSGGAALWVFSVALKFGFALVANSPVYRSLHIALPQSWADLAFWGYVGLLTGVFECGVFLISAPLIKWSRWTWHHAVALGVGFGAIEAMALGLAAVASSTQVDAWAAVTSWSAALVPPLERLLALLVHVTAVVMLVYAFVQRQWRWFWASFVYKSAVDAVAAWLLLSGTPLLSSHWLTEFICFAPFAAVGLLLTFHLKRKWSIKINPPIACASDIDHQPSASQVAARPE